MSVLMAREQNDPHLLVRFFSKPVKDEAASRTAGRPVYKDVDYVSIRWASDNTRGLEAPAHDQHRMRRGTGPDDQGGWETYAQSYPELYAAYKRGEKVQVNGTPLTEMTALSAARREELKALNIVTVEALAGLDGSNLQKLGMDGRKLKEQAEAYLQRAAGAAVDEKHAEEMEDLRQQLAELRAQMSGQAAPTPAPAKRGRGKGAAVEAENAADAQARTAFEQMGVEDLKNYLRDMTKAEPAAGLNKKQLVDEAVKANAANRKLHEAA